MILCFCEHLVVPNALFESLPIVVAALPILMWISISMESNDVVYFYSIKLTFASLFDFYRWSYGILMWEMFTLGM